MMEKIRLNIDAYALGWEQFLHTAYSFAKAGRWDDFDNVIPVYEGEEFDIQIFKNNLKRVLEFSEFDFPQITPIDVLRQIPRDRTWVGFINIGPNRSKHYQIQKYMKQLDHSALNGEIDYFWMLAKGVSRRAKIETIEREEGGEIVVIKQAVPHVSREPTERNTLLILAFTDESDLITTKFAL